MHRTCISLPLGISVDHALSGEGLLFLASEERVIVWTPWGWQTIWTFGRGDGSDQIVKAAKSLCVVLEIQKNFRKIVGISPEYGSRSNLAAAYVGSFSLKKIYSLFFLVQNGKNKFFFINFLNFKYVIITIMITLLTFLFFSL